MPAATNPAIKSQTTVLAYSDGGSPSSFTNIAGVAGISGIGSGNASMNDVSTLDSVSREKLPGLPDEGQANVTLNANPANVVQQALIAARKAQTRLEFRVTFPNSSRAVFFGYVTEFSVDIQQGQPVRGSMRIEIDGEVVWS